MIYRTPKEVVCFTVQKKLITTMVKSLYEEMKEERKDTGVELKPFEELPVYTSHEEFVQRYVTFK